MTPAEFNRLAETHPSRGGNPLTLEAARMVLVDGLTCYAAAQKTGLAKSTVTRAVERLQRPVCPACQRPYGVSWDGRALRPDYGNPTGWADDPNRGILPGHLGTPRGRT